MRVFAVDRPELPPYEMPARFKTDVVYFITPAGEHGVPKLASNEYWIRLDDARKWLDELVIEVVSPLDAAAKAEIELTEEQERWLEWMVAHGVEHVRLEASLGESTPFRGEAVN
jgi:hypothetical protein